MRVCCVGENKRHDYFNAFQYRMYRLCTAKTIIHKTPVFCFVKWVHFKYAGYIGAGMAISFCGLSCNRRYNGIVILLQNGIIQVLVSNECVPCLHRFYIVLAVRAFSIGLLLYSLCVIVKKALFHAGLLGMQKCKA